MEDINYIKAIELLKNCSSQHGFLASAENVSNYKRIWARDGVICGLAALASGDKDLIATFEKTLETLANNQHVNGTIPSNVVIDGNSIEISYGGLAGRVDAVTWFIIGVCQYAFYIKDPAFVKKYEVNIVKCLALLEAWEFNNKHLLYVPLSGNWADEYITEGYVLYDQLLRIWALKGYNYFANDDLITVKIEQITKQIEINYTSNPAGEKYHQMAYEKAHITKFMPCSFSPSGYKTQFDAFANSIAMILDIGTQGFQSNILEYSLKLSVEKPLQLIPAFWPPIQQHDADWNLLKNNCKYEFRNYPNEFHNGGSWSMVNGFFGLALLIKEKKMEAIQILSSINRANSIENYSFYENFNSETSEPNGVAFCAWSGAAAVMLHQSIYKGFKFLI